MKVFPVETGDLGRHGFVLTRVAAPEAVRKYAIGQIIVRELNTGESAFGETKCGANGQEQLCMHDGLEVEGS